MSPKRTVFDRLLSATWGHCTSNLTQHAVNTPDDKILIVDVQLVHTVKIRTLHHYCCAYETRSQFAVCVTCENSNTYPYGKIPIEHSAECIGSCSTFATSRTAELL